MKKAASILLSLLLLLSALPMAAFASDTVGTWADLQAALNVGGTITLGRDITAAASDSALVVSGATVLNLNGYMIDRSLSEPTENGNVFIVEGDLEVSGSGTSPVQNALQTVGHLMEEMLDMFDSLGQ